MEMFVHNEWGQQGKDVSWMDLLVSQVQLWTFVLVWIWRSMETALEGFFEKEQKFFHHGFPGKPALC